MAFCQKIKAGGNHLVVATSGGHVVGKGQKLRLREKELAGVLDEYRRLPESLRKAKLPDPNDASPPKRKVPNPPPGGRTLRGYCTYMKIDEAGKAVRSKEFYYKENPDRWAAETQSDMLWLTEDEWRSLLPTNAQVGKRVEVAAPIQQRFFSTIGIDYMEGSVNSLPCRKNTMTLTVEKITPKSMLLRLDGYAELGKEYDEKLRGEANSRGCEIRVLGFLSYNIAKQSFERFDVVGVGTAWGIKRRDRRAIRIDSHPWMYGIACELVTGDSPIDLIPPYNLLHYGSAGPYFAKK